ncbi:MAG: helix-hairpin-helix domain-containing protein [Terracidiphilus sp.]
MIAALTIMTAASLHSAAGQNAPPKPSGVTLPDGPGKAVVEKACLSCHDARVVTSKRASPDDWAEEVEKMIARGAVLTDDDADLVIDYLSTHYGPDDSTSGHAAAPAPEAQTSSAQSASDKTVPPPSSSATTPSAPCNAAGSLNVNKANVEELECSLGLSKSGAEAIVQYREQHGDFKSWQEVSSVPGVAPEMIKDNQKRLVF